MGLAIGIGLGLTFGGAAAAPTIEDLFGAGELGVILDPSDSSTVFQERTSPTTPAGNGDPVGTILDPRGNGYAYIAPSDAARPTLTVSGGYTSLLFNGTAHEMAGTAALNAVMTGGNWYVGAATSDFNNSERWVWGVDTFRGIVGIPASQTHKMAVRATTFFNTSGSAIPTPVTGPDVFEWSSASSVMEGFQNGTSKGTIDFSGGTITPTTSYIGSRGGSQFVGFNLYGLVVRQGVAGASVLAISRPWLAERNGATLA